MNVALVRRTVFLSATAFMLGTFFAQMLAGQDFTVRTRDEDGATAMSYISRDAIRYTSSTEEEGDSIVRLDQRKFIYLDHKRKTYSELTFDEWHRYLKSETGGDEGRHRREALGRLMATGPAKVTPQGVGETIAGYATQKYLIATPSIEMQVSVAPALDVPPIYYDAWKRASGPLGMDSIINEMKQIKGMILKQVTTVKMMNMKIETTTIATSVEKRAIPPSTFQAPSGYRLVPMKD